MPGPGVLPHTEGAGYYGRMRRLILALVLAAPALAADPAVEDQTLFAAGDGGYHTYRIPSLITTEGRRRYSRSARGGRPAAGTGRGH